LKNISLITATLPPARAARNLCAQSAKCPEIYDQKRATTYVFVEKVPHLRFFLRNLRPRNFRKFRTKKFYGPQNFRKFWTKKNLRLFLLFTLCGCPCSGSLSAIFWTGAWLVLIFYPNFRNFGPKSSKTSPKKFAAGLGC